MPKISVVIIAKNEEKDIRGCLESVKWADEIVVIDHYSSDNTVAICKEYTDRIFQDKSMFNVTRKNIGFEKASYDWILNIDADERVSLELQAEIRSIIASNIFCYEGYKIPFRTIALGQELKYGGWSPAEIKIIRFFKKGRGSYLEEGEHTPLSIDGRIGCLKNSIIHYNFLSLSELTEKINLYSSNQAIARYRQGVKPARALVVFSAVLKEFTKRYLLWLGYKDGYVGFVIASMFSFYCLLDNLKLREVYFRKGQSIN